LNITLSVSGETEQIVKKNKHVKWTEIARCAIKEEAEKQKKLQILGEYLDKKPISKDKWAWMEKNDWHPVDEMEFKPEFVERIIKTKNQKGKKINSLDELLK